MTFADELRAGCAEVAARGRWVRVVPGAIDPYAALLALPTATAPAPSAPEPDAAAFWLTLDAINFGSGWFPTLRKPAGRSGYATVAAAWRSHWDTAGPLDTAALRGLDGPRMAAILGQDPDHELMELYALSLGDLGARLDDGFDGSAATLVAAARGSAVALASELGGWPCYADRSSWDGIALPFLKRAQIVAADLGRAGVVGWDDEAELTMFADNLVPHVLRLDGVLEFAPELVARIDAGELLEHGSAEEVEIRAGAVDAVERIVAARGDGTTAVAVDELLWTRGGEPRYKALPRHRSRCTAY